MKKLIVIGHPDDSSFSYKIANNILQTGIDNFFLVDLYEQKQEYLFLKRGVVSHNSERKKIQDKILMSDEIILIFPIWWGIFPAIMKNFFDTNFLINFAFSKNAGGDIIPLLKGKSISLFATCNFSPEIYYEYIKKYVELNFVECCGMNIRHIEIIGEISISSLNDRKIYLEKVNSYYT